MSFFLTFSFLDVLLYAFSHDELPALLFSVILLVLVGRCQERRWGTVTFVALSALTVIVLPFLYTLLLFVGSGEATRLSGHSAIQLTLFTAQCRQVTQRRLLRCLPVWFLPWLLLLMAVLLLPGTPVLLHVCSIFIGHNCILFCLIRNLPYVSLYTSMAGVRVGGHGEWLHLFIFINILSFSDHISFIGMLQDLEEAIPLHLVPHWAYVPSSRFRLPTYINAHRQDFFFSPCQVSRSLHTYIIADSSFVLCLVSSCHSSRSLSQGRPVDQAAAASIREASTTNLNTLGTAQPWIINDSADLSETQLLEEQMLRAGILASLRDAPDNADAKVEVPKSSVSSLRLVITPIKKMTSHLCQTKVICYKIFKQ